MVIRAAAGLGLGIFAAGVVAAFGGGFQPLLVLICVGVIVLGGIDD